MLYKKITQISILFLMLTASAVAVAGLPMTQAEKEFLDTVEPIITHTERRTFRKGLDTHDERTDFMALFWAKRDPNLETPDNEFKQMYLERLANADRKWSYQRGHIDALTMKDLYLMLGDPTRRTMGVSLGFGRRIHSRHYRTGHLPEAWEYDNVGYGYPRKTLIVQFMPVNGFGDYIALSNASGEHFLNTLRKRLILHPNLTLDDLRPHS